MALEAGGVGTFEWNIASGSGHWSPELRALYGITNRSHGCSVDLWRACVFPEDLPAVEAHTREALRTGEFSAEWRITRQCDREIRWISGRGRILHNPDGEPVRMLGINVDITERKLAHEAHLHSEKLASVGHMALSLAHGINNPLAAAMNTLYLAHLEVHNPEAVLRHLAVVEDELKRIAHLTRQTLGFHREVAEPALVSLNSVLDSAIDVLGSKINTTRAVVVKQCRKDVEVKAVAAELRQVFANLLANSLDALPEEAKITLRLSSTVSPGTQQKFARLTVADCGRGIETCHLHRLFEPLFTTKQATAGLGLWVAKRIVEQYGGTIRVRTRTSGRFTGTVFSVSLPLDSPGLRIPHSHSDEPRPN